jgi:holo-[acyl-carrier protein] synthase
MSVVAIGLDLVEVERIRALLAKHGERFQERTFTEQECGYCNASANAALHFAARFAAKEAVAKALGTGFAEGVNWRDIEVTRSASGVPGVLLHGGAAERAQMLGIHQWLLSLTHTASTAAASVVGLRG